MLIGPSALFFHQGKYHARLRKLVQNSLSPEAIRKLIPDIEVAAISTLDTCVKARLTNTFQEMKKVCFTPQYGSSRTLSFEKFLT